MTDMMVNIIVEVLDILATATKEMKQSRASEFMLYMRSLETHMCAEKFLKKIAGITKLEDGLKKLDKMTNEEARMANAEAMRLAYDIDKKVEGLIDSARMCLACHRTIADFELPRQQANSGDHEEGGIRCSRCKTFVLILTFANFLSI